MPKFDEATVEAFADAWASIDGNLEAFRAGKGKPWEEQRGGRYDGYMADAELMLERLLARGFIVTPNGDRANDIAESIRELKTQQTPGA